MPFSLIVVFSVGSRDIFSFPLSGFKRIIFRIFSEGFQGLGFRARFTSQTHSMDKKHQTCVGAGVFNVVMVGTPSFGSFRKAGGWVRVLVFQRCRSLGLGVIGFISAAQAL